MTNAQFWGGLLTLFFGGLVVFVVVVVWQSMASANDMADTYQRLQQQGSRVQGAVVAIEQTGNEINNLPVARLVVSYQQDKKSRQASFEQVIPFTAMPRVQPGLKVPLRVDARPDGAVVVDLVRLDHPAE
ncbi:hypothetical protein SAMN02745857_01731 [Andreprevotia lacus DSM 23236]|uniref:DUF3592 domain-containing protein n=1 Tax=Andreprevotia lacus DSM 23236 TaxID=1121001 RepID=A0A1W1XK20_9NEIS|nr:DUF3592 domain-containing protein [Andreprevotia lacus]SMC23891.1 hypothetical protein SAMN02745857_01731 [Andreprevotia lacus DSM 23236]